ncbi:hypothetical protein Ddye_028159 [Dipteronia dyeriana]|uniref:Cullin N-terminal domain-containing protein n=1 Tax=Dipteronia dyeriana TaxID=168575 RepID=A0AAD9WQW5_9ROSI|nr:hypothetical protein Ddye_028159 [Dipteronia dyeriana]
MFKFKDIEEGLIIMEEAIGKAKKIMQGCPETKFTFEEYQKYYDTYDKTMQLYNQFKRSLEESLNTMAVPSLMCQDDDAYLLRQLVLIWSNYKLMARWLCRFFRHLDRCLILHDNLPSLDELTVCCFQDLAYWSLSQENRRASHYLLHPRTAEMLRQKMLSKCAALTLEGGSSVSATEEWLAALMASSINIC